MRAFTLAVQKRQVLLLMALCVLGIVIAVMYFRNTPVLPPVDNLAAKQSARLVGQEGNSTAPKQSAELTPKQEAALKRLRSAIQDEDWAAAQEILRQSPDLVRIRLDIFHPETPMHWGIRSGNLGIVKAMLTHGADVNQADLEGTHPLLIAIRNPEMLLLLLENGCNPNTRIHLSGLSQRFVTYDTTLLHIAVDRVRVYPEYERVITYLLQHGVSPNCTTEHGSTPLHVAVDNGLLQVVQLLLKEKADVNSACDDGITPLHVAARQGQREIAELLLSQGADINVRTKRGVTPLLEASVNVDRSNVVLSGKDRPVNYRALAEFLISKGATEDLFTATALGHLRLLEEAFRANVDAGAMTDPFYDQRLLHWAARYNQTKVAELLLNHKVEINAKDQGGNTAIHEAAYYGSVDTVKLLRTHNADLTLKNRDGETPYEAAVRLGHTDVARLLSGK
jgi:cytohesin